MSRFITWIQKILGRLSQGMEGLADSADTVTGDVTMPLGNTRDYLMLTETRLLRPIATVIVPARNKPFNAAELYQDGAGRYIYETFAKSLDLEAKQTMVSAPERPYVALLLKANASDTDIQKELPEEHLSILEDIAWLIEAQSDGQSGFLLSNGYVNIFYALGKIAVGVRWHSGLWCVDIWGLDERGSWFADCQVLCPGTAAL